MSESSKDRRSIEERLGAIAGGEAISEEALDDFFTDPALRAALARKDPSALFALIEHEREAPEAPGYPGISALEQAAARPRSHWKWLAAAASLALVAGVFFGVMNRLLPSDEPAAVVEIARSQVEAAEAVEDAAMAVKTVRRPSAGASGLLVGATYTPGLHTIQYEPSGPSGLRLTMVMGAEL